MQFLRTIAKDATNVLFSTLAQIAATSGDIVEIFIVENVNRRLSTTHVPCSTNDIIYQLVLLIHESRSVGVYLLVSFNVCWFPTAFTSYVYT